jgi:PhnB protein
MIIPYLHFSGTCAEALTFYQAALGGQIDAMTYADMPDAPIELADSGRIMHAALMTADQGTIFASDFPPGMPPEPQQAVSIVLTFDDVDSAQRIHDALAVGGDTVQEFGPTFFSPGYGMFRDRFGTHWIILTNA